jgi:hypothetical protein
MYVHVARVKNEPLWGKVGQHCDLHSSMKSIMPSAARETLSYESFSRRLVLARNLIMLDVMAMMASKSLFYPHC